ncbi:MAG: ABC transporter substrate-binding protein [Thermomicrobiales bacterium]|nr:ABC transporter substrate-binding protein [Thermomicrobiales bacterium]
MSREAFVNIMMDGGLDRRELVKRLVALGVAAPVAAALAERGQGAGAAPVASSAARLPAAQESDGTLIVATEADIESFDPGHAIALASTRVNYAIYEGLLKYTPGTTDLEPLLATEMPTLENGGISEDGLTYTFKLREGVKFHDGADFNAEAVRMSYRRLIDKEFEHYDDTNTAGFFLGDLTSVDPVDEHTVTFTLSKPNAAFLTLSNVYAGKIMSPKAIQEVPVAQWGEGSYGTGPFVASAWDKGISATLVRNEDYWGTKPSLKTLVFQPIIEPTARVAALLNGEVDMIVVVPPDSIQSIKDDPNLTYEQGDSLQRWFIQLNTKEGPFADKRVRQAVNYAVNKEGLAHDVLRDSAVPATQPMAPAHWTYNPDITGYPYDPEKAKALLQEAGVGDGFSTTLMIPQSGSGMMIPVPMNEFIQGNLREVGVDVQIQSYEWVSYLGLWTQGLNADVTMANMSTLETGEPYFIHFQLSGDFTPDKGGWNVGYYDNPEVTKLLAEALATPDDAQRKALYEKTWELVVDDAPWIFVVNDLQPMAFKNSVTGYLTSPSYVIDFTTISNTPQ